MKFSEILFDCFFLFAISVTLFVCFDLDRSEKNGYSGSRLDNGGKHNGKQRCHDFLFYSIDQVDLIMVDPKKSIDSVSTMGRFFAS